VRRAGAFLLFLALVLPSGGQAWTFGVCGDSRDDTRGIFPRILAAVEGSDMEFLLHLGDLENVGGAGAWERFRRRTREFSKPLRVVIGNHELPGSSREEFARFFALPGTTYSFDHRDAHFALLDDADGLLSPDRLRWLDEDLGGHSKGTNGIRFLVVAMHVPPRIDGIVPHGTGPGFDRQSGELLSILRRHKVDLLLAGHEHLHHVEDWGGVRVIVTGGAGAPMVPFHSFGFYRVRLEDDVVREQFIRIRPKPPRSRRQTGFRPRFSSSKPPHDGKRSLTTMTEKE